jgi:16S rRNA (guanine1516-N2)-methyltransferase
VRHADSRTLLAELPDKSFDVVLFDPMFTQPKKASGAFDILRRCADHAPLTQQTIERARRVARRAVLINVERDDGLQ